MPKFKKNAGLYSKYLLDKKEEQAQQSLHTKYKIEDQNIKIVEKSSFTKYLVKGVSGIFVWSARIIIFMLVVIALITLAYPTSRNALFLVIEQLIEQIRILLGV